MQSREFVYARELKYTFAIRLRPHLNRDSGYFRSLCALVVYTTQNKQDAGTISNLFGIP